MADIRYFYKVLAEYEIACNTFKTMQHDEMYLNHIAYLLQQTVEKTLKGFLDFVGVTIPITHDIEKLCKMSDNNGSSIKLTKWIKDNSDTITRWESDTRYNFDYAVELNKLIIGFEEIQKFLDINRISRKQLLNEEEKSNLRDILPKVIVPKNELEWNVYYSVFEKQINRKLKKTKTKDNIKELKGFDR